MNWKQVKIDARGGGGRACQKTLRIVLPYQRSQLTSAAMQLPFEFRNFRRFSFRICQIIECISLNHMCEWFWLCTRRLFIRSIEVGGHFRTRCLGKRTSRPWSLKSLSHIESRTVHCLTWRILTQGELVGSRVSSSVAESVFLFFQVLVDVDCLDWWLTISGVH